MTLALFRNYHAVDAPALYDLFYQAVRRTGLAAYSARQCAAWAPERADMQAWHKRLAGKRTMIADWDGMITGFVSYEPNGHIDMLYVHPDFGRKGIGRALIRYAEDRLRAKGIKELTVDASHVAKPVFEKQGFVAASPQKVERQGQTLENFPMRKVL